MSPLSNKITTVKRLSALAQLVQLYAEKGITSTKELATLTDYSERAIRWAKAEAGCRSTRQPVAAPATHCRQPVAASAGPPPLKEKSPPAPPLKKIHPSPDSSRILKNPMRETRAKDFSLEPLSSLPSDSSASHPQGPPPVFRGLRLTVSAEQHQTWKRMFPGYDLRLGYPIADAECAERGKANGAAVLHAQKKLGYLASDFAGQQAKGLSPEEAKEERLHAWLRSQNPDYVDARRG